MARIQRINEEEEVVVGGNGENGQNPPENTSNSSKKIYITIDNNIDDVIKYQNEGKEIFFKDDPGEFIQLSQEDVKHLSPINLAKYMIGKGVSERNLDLSSVRDNHKFFKPRPGFASATDRLRIEGGRPDKTYAWKRADELMQVGYDGGKVCTDPNVRTFGGVNSDGTTLRGGTTKTVSANGEDELILVEYPKEVHDAIIARSDELSVRRNRAVDITAKEEIRKAGGMPFDLDEKDM